MLPLDGDLNQSKTSIGFEAVVTPENRELARQEVERLSQLLELIRAEITLLQEREVVVETQLEAWGVIAGTGAKSSAEPGQHWRTTVPARPVGSQGDTNDPDNGNRRSIVVQETSDAVVALLAEVGGPLHYRDIYSELNSRGIEVAGEDPAKTMLARYFNDERLQRTSRGTYAIKREAGGEDVN